ncbi:MAG TPA: hypothetical protein VLF20_05855 [Patescibacteria group bacterium]|nr:hypothetical protein [Patescibacteria group bacterium]
MGRNGRSKIVKTSRRLREAAAHLGDSYSTRREDPRHLTERSGLDFRGLTNQIHQEQDRRDRRRGRGGSKEQYIVYF